MTLTAPISGVVVERQATLGQAVERSSDLFDIEANGIVWATANVPEAEIEKIVPGARVVVVSSAFPDLAFEGTVQIVGSRMDPKTRTLPVQCRVANPQGRLRNGFFARVRLATDASAFVLAVPVSATFTQEGKTSLFIEKAGKFESHAVRTGRTDGRWIEILEGIQEGERVAVAGVFTLRGELAKAELKGHDH